MLVLAAYRAYTQAVTSTTIMISVERQVQLPHLSFQRFTRKHKPPFFSFPPEAEDTFSIPNLSKTQRRAREQDGNECNRSSLTEKPLSVTDGFQRILLPKWYLFILW